MFKLSLERGEIPNDWRTANISPIGEKYKPANYRPGAVFSYIAKIRRIRFLFKIRSGGTKKLLSWYSRKNLEHSLLLKFLYFVAIATAPTSSSYYDVTKLD